MSAPLRIANCSGFYGDRAGAMREVVDGGPVDVLTGDYLAELTMLILGRQRAQDPAAGYARTFLTQLEGCLADVVARGIKVVSNAGGLAPHALAAAVRAVADRAGLAVAVAVVDGDDLLPRWAELAPRLHGGEAPPGGGRGGAAPTEVLTANAYLGCWGIAAALAGGADVVVTGRVTDASLVVGPAAWHHGWGPDDLDALAGATVAGHVLECGTQATGGNFSGFAALDPALLVHPGFPVAEVAADGSAVITKQPGSGGVVTVATVTEQLLYELTGAIYGGPDVLTCVDALEVAQGGPNRVVLRGARGLPPAPWLKVATTRLGGWRSTAVLPVVGLDVEAKAALLRAQLAPLLGQVAESEVVLVRTDSADAATQETATALLRVTVRDPDRERVGRAFTAPLVELALASIPGFHTAGPPPSPNAYGVYAPAWVPAADVPTVVTHADGRVERLEAAVPGSPAGSWSPPAPLTAQADGPTRRVPLGAVAGARSGDKGGTCTLGVYVATDAAYAWLARELTPARLVELLPEAAGLAVTRELLPRLRALLFQLPGLLGDGVAASTRADPQAKAVGEWLRSRHVDVPVALLDGV